MAIALTQRVVGADAETIDESALHAEQQAMVLLDAERGVLVNGAQVLTVGVVRHRQLPALIEVRVDRADGEELWPSGRLQRARAGDVHALIERSYVPQAIRIGAQVSGRYGHVAADLPLDAQVPRLLPRRLDVGRKGDVGSSQWEHRVWSDSVREDVLITGPAPGVIEAADRVGHPSLGAERRHHRGSIEVELRGDEIVAQRVSGPDRHLAVTGRIPRKANPRGKLPQVVLHPRVADEAFITRIQESRRRVGVLRRLYVVHEAIRAEVVDPA